MEQTDYSRIFTIPGTLSFFAEKEKGKWEMFKNADGFRIDKNTEDIHYVQFDGEWTKKVLKGYKFLACRANWGISDHPRRHLTELFYNKVDGVIALVGLKIIIFPIKAEGEQKEHHYTVGDASKETTLFKEQIYYSGGVKTTKEIIDICKQEISCLSEKVLIDIPGWEDIMNEMMLSF